MDDENKQSNLTPAESMIYVGWLLEVGRDDKTQLTDEEMAAWRSISDATQKARYVVGLLREKWLAKAQPTERENLAFV